MNTSFSMEKRSFVSDEDYLLHEKNLLQQEAILVSATHSALKKDVQSNRKANEDIADALYLSMTNLKRKHDS